MKRLNCDVAVVGGGPAGLAAACAAAAHGAAKVLIIERDRELGGILQQCIHNGFGLHRFGEELTGPGYAARYIRLAGAAPQVEALLDTTVLRLSPERTLQAVSRQAGLLEIRAGAVVLAMGCRERTRGAVRIPGSRPAGVFTAGTAQRLVNIEGFSPGKRVVILGSGDIGLIMARRMTLEGARVRGVIELMPYPGGLTRNIVQCLDDFAIPLYLGHTVTAVHGRDRVTGVTCARVDGRGRPAAGTEFGLDCDCLLLSVGLIPENELSRQAGALLDPATGGPLADQRRQTSLPGVFAAGNVLQVHDLVDFVSEEGDIAGRCAAHYARGGPAGPAAAVAVTAGEGVRCVVPQRLRLCGAEGPVKLYIRVAAPELHPELRAECGGRVIASRRPPCVRPGEMQVLELPPGLAAAAGEVRVSLRRGGGGEGGG